MYTHTHTKFKLHGHSSPDPKRSRVPSLVRSGSAARITFQLHAHKYTSSVKLHYNTTKTQTTTTIIFVSQYTLFWDVQGGGAATNIKVYGPSHKRLWNINGCVVIFLPLTPYLIQPTHLLLCPPSATERTSRTRSRRTTSSSSLTEPAASSSVSSLKDSGPASSPSSLEESASVASSASSSQSGR